jgi:hypothetical protein
MATTAPATKKSTKGRKSAAIALAIVGVAGLSLASAAQLNINSASLGAGTSVVASCDTDGIDVHYTNVYNAGTGVYDTSSVILTGVDAKCNGLKYSVQLKTGTGVGTALGDPITGTSLTVAAGSATIAVTPNQPAASIDGVAIVIYS